MATEFCNNTQPHNFAHNFTTRSRIKMNQDDESRCYTNPVVFTNYAKFHQQRLEQAQEGRFLIYDCTSSCGGYGNRIFGITMSLLFAILSNRVLLIEMTYPFDINRLLHPNAIKWNYTGYKSSNKAEINLLDIPGFKHNWPSFSKKVFNPDIGIIRLHANLGFKYYYQLFDDRWRKMFLDHFNITEDNNIFTYGCVIRYLFTYDKVVTDAINREIKEHSLVPGLYISMHYRSFQQPHPNPYAYFDYAIKIAIQMTNLSKIPYRIYFIGDSENVTKIASIECKNWLATSLVKKVHVDRFGKKSYDDVFEGFIGVIVNLEVAAKAKVLIKSCESTYSDLIESIGKFNKHSVYEIIPHRF